MNLKTPLYLLMLAMACSIITGCENEDLTEDLFSDQIDTSGDDPEGSDPDSEAGSSEEESSTEDDTAEEGTGESGSEGGSSGDSGSTGSDSCTPSNYIFEEAGGVLLGELEDSSYSGSWQKQGSGASAYLRWTGSQFLGDPGNGVIRFKIRINSPGSYRFSWRSAVTIGSNGTEHNDTWLRFPDASDFYATKANSTLYPKGTGKSPNPNGASADGWFKVYRTGNNTDFKWEAYTSDHDGHIIHADFDSPGIYTMEVSARSTGHGVDKFALVRTDLNFNDALNGEMSAISCAD